MTAHESIERCRTAAQEMRIDVLRMGAGTGANGAHFGGGLSLVEIMAVLYMGVMSVDPNRPAWPGRDRFILSKGHGAMAYYAAMKQAGFVTDAEMLTFKSNDTFLYGHPSRNLERGIDFSTGSLGLGLALAVGSAMGMRRNGNETSRVFVVLGDGECDEGSVWESAAAASHFGLGNVVAIVDKNGLQYDGPTGQILSMDDLGQKWRSFGWEVRRVDGHDVEAIYWSLTKLPSNQPTVVIANTVKGKGVSFMEGDPAWHHGRMSAAQREQAMAQVGV